MIPASTLPGTELLDDLAADAAQVRCSLHSIARANRWLGGLAAVRYGLRRALGGGACYAHRLTLLDVERLQEIAGFNQNYLHLGGAPTETRSYIDMLERELERREGH